MDPMLSYMRQTMATMTGTVPLPVVLSRSIAHSQPPTPSFICRRPTKLPFRHETGSATTPPPSPPTASPPSGDGAPIINPLASAYAPRPKAKKRDATHMLNPLPPPALSRPIPAPPASDNNGTGGAAGSNQRRPTDARPRVKLLPVKHSKLVGIEVPQTDLEKEAEEEARKVKEETSFEEEFVREKRTNRFEWVRKRLIGAKA